MSRLFTRRRILAASGALAAAGLVARRGVEAPAQAADIPPLGEAAARAGLLFGASAARETLDHPAYGALYRRHCRIVTTDWALKFGALRPRPDVWTFAEADRIVDFAAREGMAVRGHTLVWNEANPDWLRTLSAREATRVFDEHIERVVSRYAGRLHSWDIVNEPFWPDHGKPGGYRDGPWLAALGPAYVTRAFRRAGAIDRRAKLTLNEAHCEIVGGWGDAIRPRLARLVDDMLDAGVPLHAVGLQAHLKPQWGYDDDAFLAFIEKLSSRGLEIYLTELDIDDEAFPEAVAERDRRVADRYANFLRAALTSPAVKMVVTWQLADRYTFLRNPDALRTRKARFAARPLPFDDDLAPKPAAAAIAAAFAARAA